jgi:hypothetical protein
MMWQVMFSIKKPETLTPYDVECKKISFLYELSNFIYGSNVMCQKSSWLGVKKKHIWYT